MSFNQAYSELLAMLPASVIHEVWLRLTTRKRKPISMTVASGVNPMVESFLKHEVLRYQKKLMRQRRIKSYPTLTINQTHMAGNKEMRGVIDEEVTLLQKRLLEYNRATFGRFMQNLTREHERLIEANRQTRHEIDTMKEQVHEMEKILASMSHQKYSFQSRV
ncbi:unnamed protein product [Rhizophagus irregularis]|uniref:Uncharacterized protein n=1 Tax=Rhizophagus irregularis TaxID=588596 RepID=A0A2I1HRJ8_9GLOM|nr:hypothetical protein RhiirA4_486373 [Rhizophagus irregularis]CAB4426126.1 unnamed protein product [Rhizophagus irregularis]